MVTLLNEIRAVYMCDHGTSLKVSLLSTLTDSFTARDINRIFKMSSNEGDHHIKRLHTGEVELGVTDALHR